MPASLPSDGPSVVPTVNGMSNTDTAPAASPPTCPWPWCHSETTTTIGTERLTAHAGTVTPVAAPPDEVNVYLVAVDDQAPNVVIEPNGGDPTTLVLAVEQADRLAAALAVTVATATT